MEVFSATKLRIGTFEFIRDVDRLPFQEDIIAVELGKRLTERWARVGQVVRLKIFTVRFKATSAA